MRDRLHELTSMKAAEMELRREEVKIQRDQFQAFMTMMSKKQTD